MIRQLVPAFLAIGILVAHGVSFAQDCAMRLVWNPAMMGGAGTSAEPPTECTTGADSCTGTTAPADYQMGYSTTVRHVATRFVADATETICRIDGYLKKVGSPTFTITASIYDDSANHPGVIVGTGSGAVNASGVGTSYAAVSFSGVSASLTSGVTYWIVFLVSTYGDSSNYIAAQGDTTCDTGGTNEMMYSANGTSWTNYTTTRGLRHALWK